ncbi:MAG: hypothetical protein K9J13_12415 [Saprospiraceae bacterium]|nr:hypothetical protein [Saprospiraceae bacterium]
MDKCEIEDLKSRILEGMDLAFRKLVIKKSKENKELVFSIKGKIVRIKAKDLKKQMNL